MQTAPSRQAGPDKSQWSQMRWPFHCRPSAAAALCRSTQTRGRITIRAKLISEARGTEFSCRGRQASLRGSQTHSARHHTEIIRASKQVWTYRGFADRLRRQEQRHGVLTHPGVLRHCSRVWSLTTRDFEELLAFHLPSHAVETDK